MELLKKYWWVIAIIIIVIFLWYVSKAQSTKSSGCKKISWDEWIKKKTDLKDQYGGDWTVAHLKMIEQGYCEQIG